MFKENLNEFTSYFPD